MKVLLASLKTLTNSKSCFESRIKFLFRLSFALGTIFRTQADFGKTFKCISCYQKAETSSLKRVTGRNFTSTVVSDFIEASRNFILDFLHKKTTKIVKT
jgi:hypothetical protein